MPGKRQVCTDWTCLWIKCQNENFLLVPVSDCSEYSQLSGYTPGVKTMQVTNNSTKLYTAMCSEDGWTAIQSRGQFGNPADYFQRDWNEYVQGFGVPGWYPWQCLYPNLLATNRMKFPPTRKGVLAWPWQHVWVDSGQKLQPEDHHGIPGQWDSCGTLWTFQTSR